jgi:hypothetical protein
MLLMLEELFLRNNKLVALLDPQLFQAATR